MADGGGGSSGLVESRMVRFLERVPLAEIERELYRIAPRCEPHTLSLAQVIRTLGVAGVARLAGVPRAAVLQAAGPEHCALADLIQSNPYGYVEAASCAPCAGAFGPSFPVPGGGGAMAPGLARPADRSYPDPYYPDPGYRSPGGFSTAPTVAPGGGAMVAGARGTGAGAASSAGFAGGYTGAGYGTSYDGRDLRERQPLQRRGGRVLRNPGGLTAAQEAAVNSMLTSGASSAEVNAVADDFELENSTASGPPPISGWPGNVPFHKDAWNFSEGWYILQQGDTFSGLGGTYLGSPSRHLEIWHLQPYRYAKAIDPSSASATRPLVRAGERVEMPEEATERAKELVRTGAPVAPSVGGPGGNPQGAGAPWSTKKKLIVGAAVVGGIGVLGVGAYALT